MKQSEYQRFKNTFEAAYGRQAPSPLSQLLSGHINLQLITECLESWNQEAEKQDSLLEKVHQWLRTEVDPEKIESEAQIPDSYLQSLRRLDCLRAKIPVEHGGLGISQCRFSRLLERMGSWSEVLALVVSVQQLGVAQGLLSLQKLERKQGKVREQSEALCKKYLRKLAENAIGAFCLTTPETGSDPSRLQTIARTSDDQDYFELSGDWQTGGKLFTTLGTIADVYIMLAVVVFPEEDLNQLDPRKRITAFIVDRESPGINIKSLHFCGWHGLPNAAIKLENVRVPKENRVGEIGDGLKIAFMNLGSGRINIASISLGMMKQLERIARWWGVERVQGGKPIGEHELNTEQLAKMNASIYACEAFLQFVSALADQSDTDIRLEAAMLKLFSSHALVDIADETLQLRGGRGYETYASQSLRGDTAISVERLFRSARMMKIGEGGSNILRLYIMRCLLDDVLRDFKTFTDKDLSFSRKFYNFIKVATHYGKGYILPDGVPKTSIPQVLLPHLRYVVKQNRHFKRLLLFKIGGEYLNYYQQIIFNRSNEQILNPTASFEQRQVLLGHCTQIATLLSVMTVTCLRADKDSDPEGIELADEFCTQARASIAMHFVNIKNHSRKRENILKQRGRDIMKGTLASRLERNIVQLDLPDVKD